MSFKGLLRSFEMVKCAIVIIVFAFLSNMPPSENEKGLLFVSLCDLLVPMGL